MTGLIIYIYIYIYICQRNRGILEEIYTCQRNWLGGFCFLLLRQYIGGFEGYTERGSTYQKAKKKKKYYIHIS
jgi:hypothetical protein